MSQEQQITILGLCSFHPNGYFREKAIKELENYSTGNELSYILIRLNDWVEIIRERATNSIKKYLNSKNARFIVSNLPLIFHMKECKRYNHINIIGDIVSVFDQEESHIEIKRGLNSKDEKVRRYCYDIVIEKEIFNNRFLIDHIASESSAYNRLYTIRKIRKRLDSSDFEYFIDVFKADNYSPIRKILIEMTYKFNPQDSISKLKEVLLDKNGSVRRIARYFLKKQCDIDFATFYRSNLKNNIINIGAIYGIGETGTSSDTKLISSLLNYDKVRVVKATIYSLAKLDINKYKTQFISLISDSRPGISKHAKVALQEEIYNTDANSIYKIYVDNQTTYIKKNAASLLCSIKDKWEVIRYIIEISASKNNEISQIGYSALEKWKTKYNNIYTSPTEDQISNIKKALKEYGKNLRMADKNLIEFHIKSIN